MSDRKTPLLALGVVCVVIGLFLILAGLEIWEFYSYTTVRMNALGYVGIVVFVLGIILLVLSFLISDEIPREFVCPICKTSVLPGYAVCPKCGVYFKKRCAKCNAELNSTVTYCPQCGSMTFTRPDGTPEQPPQPQPTGSPTVTTTGGCISCGREIPPGSKYCPWCGTKVFR